MERRDKVWWRLGDGGRAVLPNWDNRRRAGGVSGGNVLLLLVCFSRSLEWLLVVWLQFQRPTDNTATWVRASFSVGIICALRWICGPSHRILYEAKTNTKTKTSVVIIGGLARSDISSHIRRRPRYDERWDCQIRSCRLVIAPHTPFICF